MTHFAGTYVISKDFKSWLIPRTQYTQTGHLQTGKCFYWKYIVIAYLSKLTYVED